MRVQRLKELREAIAAVEGGSKGMDHSGLPLPPGVHEWFLDGMDARRWVPPLGILLYLVREALAGPSAGAAVWIGRRCWPHLEVVERALLRRCVFVDPPDDAGRLWAIDLAARCAGAVVVADGSGLDMAASRRLQLAAEAGGGLVLCARPAAELKRLSAASARWLVRSAPSAGRNPRWTVELLRCKRKEPGSVFAAKTGPGSWTVEWKGAQRGVVVHAALVERPGPAALPAAAGLRSA